MSDSEESDLTAELADAHALLRRGLKYAARRVRNCRHPPTCPRCRTRQVQYLSTASMAPPARWKCRECGERFIYEPIIPALTIRNLMEHLAAQAVTDADIQALGDRMRVAQERFDDEQRRKSAGFMDRTYRL